MSRSHIIIIHGQAFHSDFQVTGFPFFRNNRTFCSVSDWVSCELEIIEFLNSICTHTMAICRLSDFINGWEGYAK